MHVAVLGMWCRIVDGRVADPQPQELHQYKIVVSTLHNVRKLWLSGLRKGFFTHIFIDEAAQVRTCPLVVLNIPCSLPLLHLP